MMAQKKKPEPIERTAWHCFDPRPKGRAELQPAEQQAFRAIIRVMVGELEEQYLEACRRAQSPHPDIRRSAQGQIAALGHPLRVYRLLDVRLTQSFVRASLGAALPKEGDDFPPLPAGFQYLLDTDPPPSGPAEGS